MLLHLRLLADNPAELVDLIEELLLQGTMSAALRQNVLQAVTAVPVVADLDYRWHRWGMALNIVSSSPEYQIQK